MKKIILCLSVLLIVSCSNPMNRKYDETKIEEDGKAIKESGKITDEEAKMMVGWVLLSKLQGKKLEGKTYAEILEEAKAYKKQEAEKEAKAKKEAAEKVVRFNKTISFKIVEKQYAASDLDKGLYRNQIGFKMEIQNKSTKEIRAMKGDIVFYDLFGEKIYTIALTQDDPIASGTVFTDWVAVDYNQFMDEDVQLKNKELKDLKIEFVPEKIIFADGSEM